METEESEEPPTAKKQEATVEEGPTTEQTTEESQEPPTAEKQEGTIEEQTTEESQEPPTAEEGATEEPSTVEEDGATAAPTVPASPRVLSAVKAKKIRGQSPSVGIRQSPRLLAISKVRYYC